MRVTERLATLALLLATVGGWIACGGAAGSKTSPAPVGTPTGSPSSIKNVIVVLMQNGSFDHFFGTFPGVDGITPTGFSQIDNTGKPVSPFLLTTVTPPDLPHSRQNFLDQFDNGAMDGFAKVGGATVMGHYDNTIPGVDRLWALATQFAINDRFFTSVMGDAPTNQLMMVAADDNGTPFSLQPIFPPCNTDLKVDSAYTFQNVGDQLSAKGVTWAWFNENLNDCGVYIPQQNPFQYFTSTHAAPNLRDFTEFTAALANGSLPAVSFVQPNPPHSTHPGSGSVTIGLNFLADLVEKVQASPVWNNAAIIVIWDSAGGWFDHVAPPQLDTQGLGFRVPLLVISPFAKKGFVSHVMMDDVSILRFIQEMNGLSPLNPRNSTSADLNDMFNF